MDEAGNSRTPQSAPAPAHQRRVVISYAFHDAAIAQKVCSALEAAGFPRWIAPGNVVPGTMIKGQTDLRPFQIAQVSAFRGETDEVFKWLNRAYEQKDGGGLSFIKTDPVFKVNLPE